MQTALLDLLLEEGLLEDRHVEHVCARCGRYGGSMVDQLVDLQLIKGGELARAIAARLELKSWFDIWPIDLDKLDGGGLISEALAQELRVVPIRVGETAIQLAAADPLDVRVQDAIPKIKNVTIEWVVTPLETIRQVTRRVYYVRHEHPRMKAQWNEDVFFEASLTWGRGKVATIFEQAHADSVVKIQRSGPLTWLDFRDGLHGIVLDGLPIIFQSSLTIGARILEDVRIGADDPTVVMKYLRELIGAEPLESWLALKLARGSFPAVADRLVAPRHEDGAFVFVCMVSREPVEVSVFTEPYGIQTKHLVMRKTPHLNLISPRRPI